MRALRVASVKNQSLGACQGGEKGGGGGSTLDHFIEYIPGGEAKKLCDSSKGKTERGKEAMSGGIVKERS